MIAFNLKYYLNLSAMFLRMQFFTEIIKHTLEGYNLKKNKIFHYSFI